MVTAHKQPQITNTALRDTFPILKKENKQTAVYLLHVSILSLIQCLRRWCLRSQPLGRHSPSFHV